MSKLYVDQIVNNSGNREVIIDRVISSNSYNFSGTIQFSNCGITGPFGPVLSNALSSYTAQPFFSVWGNDITLFNVIAGVQFWKVPKTATYTIRCAGARSGPSTYGGLGIDITTTYYLYSGESLRIVCGQRGEGNSGNSGGGGGASFAAVFRFGTWVPIIVSGGGGGMASNSSPSANTNRNAFDPSIRSNETRGGNGSWYPSFGFTTTTGHGSFWPGGGGGGWSYNGGDGQINIYPSGQSLGGKALSSPSPIGGFFVVGDLTTVFDGGFGGGGASGRDGGAAGGGGGWWGGNANYSANSSNVIPEDTNFLGGGSFSANAYTVNGTNNGEGFVYITL